MTMYSLLFQRPLSPIPTGLRQFKSSTPKLNLKPLNNCNQGGFLQDLYRCPPFQSKTVVVVTSYLGGVTPELTSILNHAKNLYILGLDDTSELNKKYELNNLVNYLRQKYPTRTIKGTFRNTDYSKNLFQDSISTVRGPFDMTFFNHDHHKYSQETLNTIFNYLGNSLKSGSLQNLELSSANLIGSKTSGIENTLYYLIKSTRLNALATLNKNPSQFPRTV